MKLEYVAKQQTKQSSQVPAGQNIKKDSTLWLRTAWESHLRGIHQDFLHGCNYPPVVSAVRPQLELCIWAEAALSESHRKILQCHQSCDNLGIKRARAAKSRQGFYDSSQIMVEVGGAVTVQCWGTETHPKEAPHQKTLLFIPTCVQEEIKGVWSLNLQ